MPNESSFVRAAYQCDGLLSGTRRYVVGEQIGASGDRILIYVIDHKSPAQAVLRGSLGCNRQGCRWSLFAGYGAGGELNILPPEVHRGKRGAYSSPLCGPPLAIS